MPVPNKSSKSPELCITGQPRQKPRYLQAYPESSGTVQHNQSDLIKNRPLAYNGWIAFKFNILCSSLWPKMSTSDFYPEELIRHVHSVCSQMLMVVSFIIVTRKCPGIGDLLNQLQCIYMMKYHSVKCDTTLYLNDVQRCLG